MNKQKAKKRPFQDEWKEKYGCIESGEKVICTLCTDSITARTYNIERHFCSKHKNVNEMSTDEKKEFINKCVLNYGKQNTILKSFTTRHSRSTFASFLAAKEIAMNGKPFTDGEFLKNTFINCAEHLFDDFTNKKHIIERIRDMPLSAKTVQHRIVAMAKDVDTQVKNDLMQCDVFSIALDESIDVNSMARLAIIIRYASINSSDINEELCVLASMSGTTKGADILNHVKKFLDFGNDKTFDFGSKLFSITTDGAPAMRGKNVGFLKLMENELGRPLLSFHCLIHEENLLAKASTQEFTDVMDKVVKIVNLLVARSALTHRRFKEFLEDAESEYGDLLLHSEIRWLSRGKVLRRFVDCFDEIQKFLCEIGQADLLGYDEEWFLRLLFLTDILNHFNEFNRRLQGNNLTILNMYEEWQSFCQKLLLFETDLKTRKYQYYPLLKSRNEKKTIENNFEIFDTYFGNIKTELGKRFQSFKNHGKMFSFIIKPDEIQETELKLEYFQYLKIENLSLELIDFKSNTLWTEKFKTLRKDLEKAQGNELHAISSCWSSLPIKFSCMKKIGFAILSAFGSTYKCEQIFSQMKHILSKTRSRLTKENSDACIRLKVTNYTPNLNNLMSQLQNQGSH